MRKSIFEEACCEEAWLSFLEYKKECQHLSRTEEDEIRDFIERKGYVKLCELWQEGTYPSEFARKSVISKEGTDKKRVVYSFLGDEGILRERIAKLGLNINPDKVTVTGPGEEFSFLGFAYRNGEIDLSPNTIRKTKARIKRKANALMRWQRKKGLDSSKAAIGFI